ncbi:MAG TPA: PIG-L family deacetylase, partial [Acidimicrobiales bacterium]
GGELGVPDEDALGPDHLATVRKHETELAARSLGVARVEFLGYRDSGLAGEPANTEPGSLWLASVDEVAAGLAEVLRTEQAAALVVYDEFGIYGHPDHVQVHRAGCMAASLVGVSTIYEATVDREYLHFVETHLVEEAILAGDLGLVRSHIGVPSVMVTTTVDVRDVLERKRAAMAAHASQIPETTSALQLGLEQFAAVYGWEWFVRRGPAGAIDDVVG